MRHGSVLALTVAQRPSRSVPRHRLSDYAALTKPRIISLLLVTTLAPMLVAARGWPGTAVVLWTMLGAT